MSAAFGGIIRDAGSYLGQESGVPWVADATGAIADLASPASAGAATGYLPAVPMMEPTTILPGLLALAPAATLLQRQVIVLGRPLPLTVRDLGLGLGALYLTGGLKKLKRTFRKKKNKKALLAVLLVAGVLAALKMRSGASPF